MALKWHYGIILGLLYFVLLQGLSAATLYTTSRSRFSTKAVDHSTPYTTTLPTGHPFVSSAYSTGERFVNGHQSLDLDRSIMPETVSRIDVSKDLSGVEEPFTKNQFSQQYGAVLNPVTEGVNVTKAAKSDHVRGHFTNGTKTHYNDRDSTVTPTTFKDFIEDANISDVMKFDSAKFEIDLSDSTLLVNNTSASSPFGTETSFGAATETGLLTYVKDSPRNVEQLQTIDDSLSGEEMATLNSSSDHEEKASSIYSSTTMNYKYTEEATSTSIYLTTDIHNNSFDRIPYGTPSDSTNSINDTELYIARSIEVLPTPVTLSLHMPQSLNKTSTNFSEPQAILSTNETDSQLDPLLYSGAKVKRVDKDLTVQPNSTSDIDSTTSLDFLYEDEDFLFTPPVDIDNETLISERIAKKGHKYIDFNTADEYLMNPSQKNQTSWITHRKRFYTPKNGSSDADHYSNTNSISTTTEDSTTPIVYEEPVVLSVKAPNRTSDTVDQSAFPMSRIAAENITTFLGNNTDPEPSSGKVSYNITEYKDDDSTNVSDYSTTQDNPNIHYDPIVISNFNANSHHNYSKMANYVESRHNSSADSDTSKEKPFLGLTLKVSHLLIPKQKRSRINIKNMDLALPTPESLTAKSRNSNCTRFPTKVLTDDKASLTEEHYDCEVSTNIGAARKGKPNPVRTYYGGYVYRYTIPQTNESEHNRSSEMKRSTAIAEDGDDYYSYEYTDGSNGSTPESIEDGVFPDPDMNKGRRSKETDIYNITMPDSSSANSDLHDHDIIDSVMYIYFGGATHGQRGAGRQIIIVGAVIALVAQFLTLASSIRRIGIHHNEEPTVILLNIETALTLTNLIFILGVQSTSDHAVCKVTGVTLYYLHMSTSVWFLLSSLYSVQALKFIKTPIHFGVFCLLGWTVPVALTTIGYIFNERSYETNLYCWISPLRGILFSFIVPILIFCAISIILTSIGLKAEEVVENSDDMENKYSYKKLLRISAVSLPLFAVIWFTGMISLEDSSSLVFSLLFLISDTVLNWLLFACWLPSETSQWRDMDEDYYDDDDDFEDEPALKQRRFDEPLLSELYEYGAQGHLYNLRAEPISIISTN